MLVDNGCVVPSFVFLFKCMVGPFFVGGEEGEEGWGP